MASLGIQKNWIGKSMGAEVDFSIKGKEDKLRVYTTRCDTLFGVTYMVVSPEYLLSFERRSFHTHPPDHYAPVSCLLGMSASQSSALMPLHSLRSVTNRPEGTFGSLRYAFGGSW